MVPVYAIYSTLSIFFYSSHVYFALLRDRYEQIYITKQTQNNNTIIIPPHVLRFRFDLPSFKRCSSSAIFFLPSPSSVIIFLCSNFDLYLATRRTWCTSSSCCVWTTAAALRISRDASLFHPCHPPIHPPPCHPPIPPLHNKKNLAAVRIGCLSIRLIRSRWPGRFSAFEHGREGKIEKDI